MRRLALILVVAGAVLAPATAASAHAGEAPDATAYRTVITGVRAPEGVTVRTVEAGSQLELSNDSGQPVEVLGYSGEPYLEVRPDGTYENASSPATYLNATLAGDSPVPLTADPTAPPAWRKISDATTVRWHDQRTHWLDADLPPQAIADPSRPHRLRDWSVPLRVHVQTYAINGTLTWEPPPRAWLWWAGAAIIGLGLAVVARRWVRPVALLAGSTPLVYATTRALDGGELPLVLLLAGLLGLAAAYRHPPFYLALAGAVVALFGGFGETAAFDAAVLPAAGPGTLARLLVTIAIGAGAALALTGVLRLRAALPAAASEPSIVRA